MVRRLRRRVIESMPEPTLRRLQRLRHRETPALTKPVRRLGPRSIEPEVVTEFDAHAVRADVARTVVDALEAAGVAYVLVPGPRGRVGQIGVDGGDRAALLSALEPVLGRPGWSLDGDRGSGRTLRVSRVLAAPTGAVLDTRDTACEIAFWVLDGRPDPRHFRAAPYPPGTRVSPPDNPVVGHLTAEAWQRAVRAEHHWPVTDPLPDVFEVRDPVDVVYTWVDGDDPQWQRRKAEFVGGGQSDFAANHSRFANRDELRYSMRSVAMFASWVRRIYLVTDGQVPNWLDPDHPKVTVVDHRDIFTDPSVLPVFNSHAIESQLHHIPDLAEQFLYCNDDIFFGRSVEPELFFHSNGISKFFLSRQTLDLDPPSADDLPVLNAAKNNRALLEREFGVTLRHKFRHTAHPQLRSVLAEIEARHPELFAQVAASRFRHVDDVSIASALHHYYAYARGRAVPGETTYRYQDLGRPETARRLDEFLRERPQLFCINDLDSPEGDLQEQRAVLSQFFGQYFPLPAPWERDR